MATECYIYMTKLRGSGYLGRLRPRKRIFLQASVELRKIGLLKQQKVEEGSTPLRPCADPPSLTAGLEALHFHRFEQLRPLLHCALYCFANSFNGPRCVHSILFSEHLRLPRQQGGAITGYTKLAACDLRRIVSTQPRYRWRNFFWSHTISQLWSIGH